MSFITAVGEFLEVLDLQTPLEDKALGKTNQHLDTG